MKRTKPLVTKVCNGCHKRKSVDKYRKATYVTVDGHISYRPLCKDCDKAYSRQLYAGLSDKQKEHRRQYQRDYIQNLKQDNPELIQERNRRNFLNWINKGDNREKWNAKRKSKKQR